MALVQPLTALLPLAVSLPLVASLRLAPGMASTALASVPVAAVALHMILAPVVSWVQVQAAAKNRAASASTAQCLLSRAICWMKSEKDGAWQRQLSQGRTSLSPELLSLLLPESDS